MASITSSGIGSGLDINSLVSQVMALERRPLATLDRKEAAYQGQLSAYGQLKGALSGFQTSVRALTSLAKFQAFKATSADSTLYTASADASAIAGSYAIEVKQLAQSHKLSSKAFTNTTDIVGSGTLTFQFGTFDGASFAANAAQPAQVVTIGAGSASLAGIRDAVNAANIGVTASILNDGSGNKLIFTSTDTGAANSLRITVSNDGTGTNVDDNGLSQLAYDPSGTLGNGKNLTQTVAAQNATLKVDGVDNISKASNTVTDVIQGVTLTLLKTSAANTATALAVSRDTASVKTAVDEFARAHNELNTKFRELTGYDPKTKKGGLLQGDVSTLGMLGQIRRTLSQPIAGLRGAYTSLAQIGVAFQKDGSLGVDATKLQTALDGNFNDIAGLFAAVGRPSDSLIKYVGAAADTAPGNYVITVSQLATRATLNGAVTAGLADTNGTFTTPVSIGADNDTLAVKIDGVQSGTVTFSSGTYATAAALTAELQSKINGDAALKAAGVSIEVSFDADNDRLVLASSRHGTGSSIDVTAIDVDTTSTLGISVASGSSAVDAAGTINGASAEGGGRFLTGSGGNAAAGLRLEVLGGATGHRGTVDFSQGYAYQLDRLIDQLLSATGPLSSRTDGIQKSIDDVNTRRDVLNRRLEQTEERFRAQFNALDTLLSRLRTTSDYLTRQLASLPSAGGTDNKNSK